MRAELVQLCACLLPLEAVECGTVAVLLESLQWRLIKPGGHLHHTLKGMALPIFNSHPTPLPSLYRFCGCEGRWGSPSKDAALFLS